MTDWDIFFRLFPCAKNMLQGIDRIYLGLFFSKFDGRKRMFLIF